MPGWLRAALLAIALASAGPEAPASGAVQALPGAIDEATATVVFCRRVDAATGRRIGVGDRFAIARRRDVRGVVSLAGLREGRTYAVHLQWLDPAGGEVFRKYALLTARRDGDGWLGDLRWKSTVDLVRSDAETLRTAEPVFTLETQIGISPERQRPPGRYALRVFLDRKLLAEAGFALLAEEPEKPADEQSGSGTQPAGEPPTARRARSAKR